MNDNLKEEYLYKRPKRKSGHKKSGVKTRCFKMVSFTYSIHETHHDIPNSSLTIELVQNDNFHI